MKKILFIFTILFLTSTLGIMAEETFENLDGIWLSTEKNSNKFYTIAITGDKIKIKWKNEILCDTSFIIENNELKNTQKRKNWEEYVEMHQYEYFGHFERILFEDNQLTGLIFVADMGYLKVHFTKN